MRILHVTDRLSTRGGAHWHMLGVIGELARRGHHLHLAAGRQDPGLAPPCPVTLVPGSTLARASRSRSTPSPRRSGPTWSTSTPSSTPPRWSGPRDGRA